MVAALLYELEEGQWSDQAAFLIYYPQAAVARGVATIFLGQSHRVALAINFDRQIAVVAFAGRQKPERATSARAQREILP